MRRERPRRAAGAFLVSEEGDGQLALAIRLLYRPAALRWMRPLRAARSSSLTAWSFTSAEAPGALAFLSAVRNVERWARFRALAARDFRRFFFADAILGTETSEIVGSNAPEVPRARGVRSLLVHSTDVKAAHHLACFDMTRGTTLPFVPFAHATISSRPDSDSLTLGFQNLLLFVPMLLFSVIAHEYAHGYAALKHGDTTARDAGRLTWNPLKHIDPWMTLLLPAILWYASGGTVVLGGAKPVPVDPRNYRHYRRGDIIVSLAGVVTNLLIACGCTIVVAVLGLLRTGPLEPSAGILQGMTA